MSGNYKARKHASALTKKTQFNHCEKLISLYLIFSFLVLRKILIWVLCNGLVRHNVALVLNDGKFYVDLTMRFCPALLPVVRIATAFDLWSDKNTSKLIDSQLKARVCYLSRWFYIMCFYSERTRLASITPSTVA